MIQCSECEYCIQGPGGRVKLTCNPFTNIKEPQCLEKWQLVRLDEMVQSYRAMVAFYRKLAPMQEKMFRHMEREIDDIDEADQWKQTDDDSDEDDNSPQSGWH